MFTDKGKSCPCRKFLNVANMSFNDIRENKIIANISEFTVFAIISTLWTHWTDLMKPSNPDPVIFTHNPGLQIIVRY